MSKERGQARSEGEGGPMGSEWKTIGALNDVNTDDRITAAGVEDEAGDSPEVWLDVGDVDDELASLVDQKIAGEIRDADFRVALSRLLDIKHARSVADIQEEALQRKNAYRRQSSWAAGTTVGVAAKAGASRRLRARARAARAVLEETRRSNVENAGNNNNSSSSNSNRRHQGGESCTSEAGRALPRGSGGVHRGRRSGLPSGLRARGGSHSEYSENLSGGGNGHAGKGQQRR